MNRIMRMATVLALAGTVTVGAGVVAAGNANRQDTPQAEKTKPARSLSQNPKWRTVVAALKQLTLTGKVEQVKAGARARTNKASYVLVTASGDRIRLPAASKAAKGKPDTAASKAAAEVKAFLGQDVQMVVMASERKTDGKAKLLVKQIKSIEKAPTTAA